MMRPSPTKPCPEWADSLAALHPDDLAPARRAALAAHLPTCAACSAVLADYQRLERAIQQIPTSRPLPAFPPQLLAEVSAAPGRRRLKSPLGAFRHEVPAGLGATSRRSRLRGSEAALSGDFNRRSLGAGLRLIPQQRPAPLPPGRLRGLATVLAIAVVVALFVAVFRNFAGSHAAGGSGQPTTAPTQVVTTVQITTGGSWTIFSGLVNEQTLPVLAPSDPRVVYEGLTVTDTTGNVVQWSLRRSNDDGATWQALPQPGGQLPTVDLVTLAVSPLNAATVFLTLSTFANNHPGACPGTQASGAAHGSLAARSGSPTCSLQYISTDSGQSWIPLHLPAGGILGAPYFPDRDTPGSSSIFRAQGQRLYSALGESNVHGAVSGKVGTRLVSSDDGGLHWQLVDAALAASGQMLCDYAPTPIGSTLYAITQISDFCYDTAQVSSSLWSSNDAGATWTRVASLPATASNLTLVSRGTSAAPLLYVHMPSALYNGLPASAGSPAQFAASSDGGQTWRPTPTTGIPTGATNRHGPLGVLSDGSVLLAFETPDHSLTLATWKLGAAAVQPILGDVSLSLRYLLVTASNAKASFWVVFGGSGSYTVQRFDLK